MSEMDKWTAVLTGKKDDKINVAQVVVLVAGMIIFLFVLFLGLCMESANML